MDHKIGEMDEKPKKHQFVHVPPVETEDTKENECFHEGSENDVDDTVPLGLTGKAVCMQVRHISFCSLCHQHLMVHIALFPVNLEPFHAV